MIAFGYEVNPIAGEVHDYATALKELADKRVDEAAGDDAAEDGVEVEAMIVEKSAAQALAELADERDARVIVVGTPRREPDHGRVDRLDAAQAAAHLRNAGAGRTRTSRIDRR